MEPTTDLPTCYRHPGRPTRISCSDCGRPICPDCAIDAPVGQKCPTCAAQQGRGRVVSRTEMRARLTGTSHAPVTMAIIAVCAVVFVLGAVSPVLDRRLFVDGALYPGAISDGEPWRLVTSAFLHSGISHIVFNMWALYLFGPQLERQVGSGPFAALYLSSALAGGAFFLLAAPSGPAVGASGAVFGLLGTWLAGAYRSRHTPAGRSQLQGLLVLVVINMALPIFIPSIAWQAHVGGLAAGALIAWLWTRIRGEARVRAGIALAVGAVAFLLALVA